MKKDIIVAELQKLQATQINHGFKDEESYTRQKKQLNEDLDSLNNEKSALNKSIEDSGEEASAEVSSKIEELTMEIEKHENALKNIEFDYCGEIEKLIESFQKDNMSEQEVMSKVIQMRETNPNKKAYLDFESAIKKANVEEKVKEVVAEPQSKQPAVFKPAPSSLSTTNQKKGFWKKLLKYVSLMVASAMFLPSIAGTLAMNIGFAVSTYDFIKGGIIPKFEDVSSAEAIQSNEEATLVTEDENLITEATQNNEDKEETPLEEPIKAEKIKKL